MWGRPPPPELYAASSSVWTEQGDSGSQNADFPAPPSKPGVRRGRRGGGGVDAAEAPGRLAVYRALRLPAGAWQGAGPRHLPCLRTVTRTLEVLLPTEERTEQRYSALSPMASRSQLSTWVLPSSSAWVCVGTHVSISRPFFSQTK